jgi:nucleoporin GLE1
LAEVKSVLDKMRQHQHDVEKKMMEALKHREQQLWGMIETAIKLEEDKVTKRLEEERKVKEEEERKRKEAELKRRLAEEKRLQEEAEKKKVEEEKKRQEEEAERKENEAEQRRQKLEKERIEQEKGLGELREMLNFAPPEEDWRVSRTDLLV